MGLPERELAALAGTAILWECLADQRVWTCRHCGYNKNWIATEVCDKCGVEDCGQGDEEWLKELADGDAK